MICRQCLVDSHSSFGSAMKSTFSTKAILSTHKVASHYCSRSVLHCVLFFVVGHRHELSAERSRQARASPNASLGSYATSAFLPRSATCRPAYTQVVIPLTRQIPISTMFPATGLSISAFSFAPASELYNPCGVIGFAQAPERHRTAYRQWRFSLISSRYRPV